MNPEIIDYIRQNRDNYTREAITQQLLGAGYTPVEIGAAWRTVEGSHFSDSNPSDDPAANLSSPQARRNAGRFANSPRFWSIFLGFLILSYLVPGLLVYIGLSQPNASGFSNFGIVLFFGLQALALIFGFILLGRDRATGMGLLISVLTAVVILPFLSVAVLFGICFGAFRA